MSATPKHHRRRRPRPTPPAATQTLTEEEQQRLKKLGQQRPRLGTTTAADRSLNAAAPRRPSGIAPAPSRQESNSRADRQTRWGSVKAGIADDSGRQPPRAAATHHGSRVGSIVPERPELAEVPYSSRAHAGLKRAAVAVADDQPPALGDRAHYPHGYRHRCGHDATRPTSTIVGCLVGLDHHGALAATTTSDEHDDAGGSADEHAEQAPNLAHRRTAAASAACRSGRRRRPRSATATLPLASTADLQIRPRASYVLIKRWGGIEPTT